MESRFAQLVIASSLFGACSGAACAEWFRLESAGARAGFAAYNSGYRFHQVEADADWTVPLSLDFGRQWWLRSRVEVSAGWLGDPGHDAFICGAGPNLLFGRGNCPVTFEAGWSPTFISRSDFDSKDFGTSLQFTSSAGLNVDVWHSLRVGYRFQHMSNGDLATSDPGLNLHMVTVSYLF